MPTGKILMALAYSVSYCLLWNRQEMSFIQETECCINVFLYCTKVNDTSTSYIAVTDVLTTFFITVLQVFELFPLKCSFVDVRPKWFPSPTFIYLVIFSILICHILAILLHKKILVTTIFLGWNNHLCKDIMTSQRQFERC